MFADPVRVFGVCLAASFYEIRPRQRHILLCNISNMPYAGKVVRIFFMMPMQFKYCLCGSNDYSDKVECMYVDTPYKSDSGLSRMKMTRFLDSMSVLKHNQLWKIVGSFQ